MNTLLKAVVVAAAVAAAPALAADDAAAVAGLKALAADASAPTPAVLSEYGFHEATYLMDQLSDYDLRRLRRHIDDRALDLPTNIEGAIHAKTARPRSNQGGQ